MTEIILFCNRLGEVSIKKPVKHSSWQVAHGLLWHEIRSSSKNTRSRTAINKRCIQNNAFWAKNTTFCCIAAETEWCGLAINHGDDLQVVFHPSLQHCETTGFRTDDNRFVHAAFQLLVKPGAYCVVRESVDWSTKETGAIVLHSLLFKFSSN